MLKKMSSMLLIVLVMNLAVVTAFAETTEEKAAKLAEKVKANITKLGIGKDARIEVKLKDGTKLKGYVSQINENSFVIVNEMTGTTTEVPYPQAKQVKGNNLSTGVKIVIVVVIIIIVGGLLGRLFAQ